MVKKYYLKDCCAINKKYGQLIGETLEDIKTKKGKLTPDLVLEDAKKTNSKLHKFFEWDNTIAGQKWRRQQAMQIIGAVVEVVVIEGQKSKQRSFFNVKDENNERVYVTIKEVKSNNDYKKKLLDDIIKHLDNTTTLMKMFRDN